MSHGKSHTRPVHYDSPSGKQKKSYLCTRPCNVPVFVNVRIFRAWSKRDDLDVRHFQCPTESHTHDLFTTSLVVLLVLVVLIVLMLVLLW